MGQRAEHEAGHHERAGHGDRAQPAGHGIAQPPAEADQHHKADERQQWHEVCSVEHGSGQPFSEWRSSATVVERRRKLVTTMPRPTTTSAAATTSTKKTMA